MKPSYTGYDATLDYQPLASIFKSLSHPTRLAILNLLIKHQSLNCGEIVDKIPRSQSTVSQHLQELYKEGFVKVSTKGPVRIYEINESKIVKLEKKMSSFLGQLKSPKSLGEEAID